jgi:hypothetical protein
MSYSVETRSKPGFTDHRRSLEKARSHKYRERHGLNSNFSSPFIGVDGEGGGTDDLGRQNFLLLRAGHNELFCDNRPLTTVECLEFLLDQPKKAVLVGYFFTYDATMILRDLPPDYTAALFREREEGKGTSYVFWKQYAIEFRPRQYFRVARVNRETNKIIPGTNRTVNEVGGFFQKSFVEAIRNWGVGDDDTVNMIAENKERRAGFTTITDREREYCAAECTLLAQLMTKLRNVCKESDIVPASWRGAGALAARLHQMHSTPRNIDRPLTVEKIALQSYFGGRFEITQVGRIPGPIYEYDIKSAYPAAMLKLPCPKHTRWRKFNNGEVPGDPSALFVAHVYFKHAPGSVLCGFPVRRKGRLYWPIEGNGTYWSPEIAAARGAGAKIDIDGGYAAQITCDCPGFSWVDDLYRIRQRIGSSTKGYPIKLGLNALYGKLAQRQGAGPWRDHLMAGLITAYTRAQLQTACNHDPGAVVMLATDAVFSRRRLPLEIGEALGQWEEIERPTGLFVVQPGIYWSPGSETLPKTRGIPRSRIINERHRFEAAWDAWCSQGSGASPPAVAVDVTTFVGHRLALARGKPDLAGTWIEAPRKISFDWQSKRLPVASIDGGTLYTMPYHGGPTLKSSAFDPKLLLAIDEQMLETEAMPDHIELGNTGE